MPLKTKIRDFAHRTPRSEAGRDVKTGELFLLPSSASGCYEPCMEGPSRPYGDADGVAQGMGLMGVWSSKAATPST
jgi:hypothetical protein